MSRLIDFYTCTGRDVAGRRLEDIWNWSDADFEDVHDFIQWLFPTPTASAYNRLAPVLLTDDIARFRSDEKLKSALRRSFVRFLRFLGLDQNENGEVVEARNFELRKEEIWTYENHNWLRISRVLMSLRTLGLEKDAVAFFDWLQNAIRSGVIGAGDENARSQAESSLAHWAENAQH